MGVRKCRRVEDVPEMLNGQRALDPQLHGDREEAAWPYSVAASGTGRLAGDGIEDWRAGVYLLVLPANRKPGAFHDAEAVVHAGR